MGKSYAGAFGVGKETTFGVPVAPTISLPVTQCGIKPSRPAIKRGGIYSSRQVQCQTAGLQNNAGPFTLEGDAIALGFPLLMLFGAVTSMAMGGTIAAAATTTPNNTGGNLAAGGHLYRVANIFGRNSDGAQHIGAASPASAAATTTGTNGQVVINWVNATIPAGYDTLLGSFIYRNEGSGSFLNVGKVSGSTATFTDTGATAPGKAVAPEQTYVHTFIPPDVADASDIPSFTATINVDLPYAVRVDGCKINQMTATVAEDGNSPVTFVFDTMGRRAQKVANYSPAHTPICPMLSWQSRVTVDGIVSDVAKAMTVVLNNNLTPKRALNGNPFVNKFDPGMLEATGSLTNDWANFEFYDRLLDGTKFDLLNKMEGPATTDKANIRVDENTLATPIPFSVEFHMPSCLLDGEGGGDLNGGDSIDENPSYSAGVSLTAGYAIRARLVNRTPSY